MPTDRPPQGGRSVVQRIRRVRRDGSRCAGGAQSWGSSHAAGSAAARGVIHVHMTLGPVQVAVTVVHMVVDPVVHMVVAVVRAVVATVRVDMLHVVTALAQTGQAGQAQQSGQAPEAVVVAVVVVLLGDRRGGRRACEAPGCEVP